MQMTDVVALPRMRSAPRSHRMPVFPLSDQQRFDLAAFLASRTDSRAAPPKDSPAGIDRKELRAFGKRLVTKLGCAACHLIHAERDRIYILKPDLLGQWTRTAALNDAEEIYQAIVLSKRGD